MLFVGRNSAEATGSQTHLLLPGSPKCLLWWIVTCLMEFCGLLYFVKLSFYIRQCLFMCIIRVHRYRQQCYCQVLVMYLAYDSLTEPTSPSHRICCSVAKESHMTLLIGCFQICGVRATAGLYPGCQGSMALWSSLRTPLKRVSMAKFMRLGIPCCVFWETLGAFS